MKKIKYKFLSCQIIKGTEENPIMEDLFLEKSMGWNEANEEIAKREAYNGVYTIEDDGQPEVISVQDDVDNILVDHELRLTMLELGV